jgi:hypothetical protein
MREVLIRLVDVPLARILVLAGFIFILVGILGKIEGKIEPGPAGRLSAAIIGALLLAAGVFMQYSELRYAELHEMNAKAVLDQTTRQQNLAASAAHPAIPIKVVSGTYGRNCNATSGNATAQLAGICNGTTSCDFVIDPAALEDPAPNCGKDFAAEWKCGDGNAVYSAVLPALSGKNDKLRLNCAG